MEIKIKKLDERARIPHRGSNYAAGYDLYALDKAVVCGGESTTIHTGIAVEIPEGYFGAIYARSGLACKHGLRPANCVGIIDSDYRGEVMIVIHNDVESVKTAINQISARVSQEVVTANHDASYTIEEGDRVAQLIIQKFEAVDFVEVDDLEGTDRGDGGFGSTGKG